MKNFTKLASLILALVMLLPTVVSCTRNGNGNDTTTEAPDVTTTAPSDNTTKDPSNTTEQNPPEDEEVCYNIIFALATIPPVMGALESIANGYETYAIIERGKTYSGIDKLEYFHNVGFDANNNLSTGFTDTEFDTMVAKVKELKAANPDAYFYFHTQDGTALKGAAIAANAGLSVDQFHVYMYEDGTGAYNALRTYFIDNKKVDATKDEPYDYYKTLAAEMKADFDTVMSKTDNKNADAILGYSIRKAFARAAHDNFTYCIQDGTIIENILKSAGDEANKTKLLASFGVEGYTEANEFKLNLSYGKISDKISKLTEQQKTDYLTLMYGQYFEDTYANLTRTQRAGTAAPSKKLVFIGSRHSGYPKFASDAAYGIGGLADGATVPASYAELDAKYKMPLLFATEADYTSFLAILNNDANYVANTDPAVKELAKTACFNTYINYIFTLKLTYAQYGADYDIIMKGHPGEVIGKSSEWGRKYPVTYGEDKKYYYDALLDAALLNFHAADSTGKFIGMVPYGTAAENLAYLGADLSICGLPSSTYNGYDTDVDVLFIMALSNQTIADTESQVKERFEAGNLVYTDKAGNEKNATFYNTGNVLKTVGKICRDKGNTSLADSYDALFAAWLTANHPGKTGIDDQGFGI